MAHPTSDLNLIGKTLSGERWRGLSAAFVAYEAWDHPATAKLSSMPKDLETWLNAYGPGDDVAMMVTVDGHIMKSSGVTLGEGGDLWDALHPLDQIHQSHVVPTQITTKHAKLWIVDWHSEHAVTSRVHHHWVLASGQSLEVIWCTLGADQAQGLHHARCQWSLGEDAALYIHAIQDLPTTVCHLMTGSGVIGARGHLTVKECRLGASHSRVEWLPKLASHQSVWTWSELSIPKGAQHHDQWVEVVQSGEETRSDCVSRSLVADSGVSRVRTWVNMAPGCTGAEAHQHHRHWLLSKKALVESLPHLEVHHDQVTCHHGVIIAGLEDGALFYMHCRGLSTDDARQLLCMAFVEETIATWDSASFALRAYLVPRMDALI